MNGLQVFAVISGGSAGGQSNKLDQMTLKIGDVLGGRVPSLGLVATKKSPLLHCVALPVYARVMQHTRRQVGHNIRDARLTAEAVEEGKFTFDLGGLVRGARSGAIRNRLGGHSLFGSLFSG